MLDFQIQELLVYVCVFTLVRDARDFPGKQSSTRSANPFHSELGEFSRPPVQLGDLVRFTNASSLCELTLKPSKDPMDRIAPLLQSVAQASGVAEDVRWEHRPPLSFPITLTSPWPGV